MKKVILHIYDFLSSHKGLAAGILGLLMGFCALSALHMDY